jgi:hypothetical protein
VVVRHSDTGNQIVQAENIKQLLMGKIQNNFNGKGFNNQRQSSIGVLLCLWILANNGEEVCGLF